MTWTWGQGSVPARTLRTGQREILTTNASIYGEQKWKTENQPEK